MRIARLLRRLRARWETVSAKPQTRMTFVMVATALGAGTYYYPIINGFFPPESSYTKEQQAFYDKNNYYPIKLRKQRDQEVQEKSKAVLESTKSQLP